MDKQEDTKTDAAEPSRRWQFGLKSLLLLPVALGLLLGIFIALYPFSWITLPVLAFSLFATADSGIHWMEPRDLDAATMVFAINPPQGPGISSHHCDATWWRRPLGANVALADGSVRFLPMDTPGEQLRAMLTIAGGETAEEDEVKD